VLGHTTQESGPVRNLPEQLHVGDPGGAMTTSGGPSPTTW
jgi:hypothetical protein